MKLIFKKISWKNFLSTGNYWNSINLNQNENILIYGENSFGKSTVLDALCFSLYGKAFRNINKTNLINSINQRECLTEIEFEIDSKSYRILRGIKPNVFEIYCNDKLINQDSTNRDYQDYLEKSILRLNYKSFTQIVILGSASFTPFMQLTTSDRRNVVEDLLDIQIFSVMNDIVKNRISNIKELIQSKKYEIDLNQSKLEIHEKHLNDINLDKLKEIELCNKELNDLQNVNAEINEKCSETSVYLSKLDKILEKESVIKNSVDALNKRKYKLEAKIKKLKSEFEFYSNTDDCPTCKQKISAEFKKEKITEIEEQIKNVNTEFNKISDGLVIANKNYKIILNTKDKRLEKKLKLTEYKILLETNEKLIKKYSNKILTLENNNTNIEDLIKIIDDVKKDIQSDESNLSELLKDKQKLEIASDLLKDSGIKTRIIKKYLPIINDLINKYLSKLEFFVDFSFDETFKETIKSRYRDEFSYFNFSEGEKSKINLAILFAWRELTKIRSSFYTNLLIMDEIIDGALDFNSIDNFFNLLETDNKDMTVFVISPKGESYIEKFNKNIKFIKENGFSRIDE